MKLFCFLIVLFFINLNLYSEKNCVYFDHLNRKITVKTLNQIPTKFKKLARCGVYKDQNNLNKPENISLSGHKRKASFITDFGSVNLRWTADQERYFPSKVKKSVLNSFKTFSKTIRNSEFYTVLKDQNLNWEIVFINDKIPLSQIPSHILNGCHPGWMTPPANIYILTPKIAIGCNMNKKVDNTSTQKQFSAKALEKTLIHEFGHVVENAISKNFNDRFRAEGFARWFETFASKNSPFLNKSSLINQNKKYAKYSYIEKPSNFSFKGSYTDYARAFMFFHVLEDLKGTHSILDYYSNFSNQNFHSYLDKRYKIDDKYILNNYLK